MKTLNYDDKILYFFDEDTLDRPVKNSLLDIISHKGLTASDLSKITGISKHRISDIINNNVVPRIDAALEIAYVLGVRVEDIFSLTHFSDYRAYQNNQGETLYYDSFNKKVVSYKDMRSNIKNTSYEFYDSIENSLISRKEYLALLREFKEINLSLYLNLNLNIYPNITLAKKQTHSQLETMFNQKYKKIYLKIYEKNNMYRISKGILE